MIENLVTQSPPNWLIIPFVSLLLMIASGPVFFPTFWHKHYKWVSMGMGILVAAYYLFHLHNTFIPIETLAEYVSFISLLTILYIASGGIYLFVDVESKVWVNIAFLFIAALLTNIIGTTGASVLFIRPFMRLNRFRLKPYHIVFFIFLVSNIGGSLTPIGDPPLFLGFLKGVPFFWTFEHLFLPWLFAVVGILTIFYFFEKKNNQLNEVDVSAHYTGKIILKGKQNLIWLFIGVATVFIDPNILDGIPYFDFHGRKISFIRELLQLSAAFFCYRFADKKVLQSNHFDFEPLKEVVFLFLGIFLCMMPTLQNLEGIAHEYQSSLNLTPSLIYLSSGFMSAVLDNAPTFLNVFTLILSSSNLSVNSLADVQTFVIGEEAILLQALSAGAVFFGALTYIGNGPNFMVKAIAEQAGVKMPDFGRYLWRYSLPILLPVLLLVCLLFFI